MIFKLGLHVNGFQALCGKTAGTRKVKSLLITFFVICVLGLTGYGLFIANLIPTVDQAKIKGVGQVGVGSRIYHETFGEGKVKKIQDTEAGYILGIQFKEEGLKWLVADYSKLSPVDPGKQ